MKKLFKSTLPRLTGRRLYRCDESALVTFTVLLLYSLIVSISLWLHEPWADEAQAWVLARDAGLFDLWTHLLHYEGSPGLWHTVLMALAKSGLPYRIEGITSALLCLSAVWLWLTRSPFPLLIRILLPFTYFLCYQYAVVARSYSLLPVLLFGCVLLFNRVEERPVFFTFVLSLLASASAHGFLLSAAIWAASRYSLVLKWGRFEILTKRRVMVSDALYCCVMVLLAWSSWPAKDVAFPAHAELTTDKITRSALMFLSQGFGGNLYVSLLVIGLSIPLLYAGGGLLMFSLSFLALIGFGGVVYAQVWHSGTIFLAWISAMWISATNVKVSRAGYAALALTITVQCFWTFSTASYDWRNSYSGSKAAAQYLRKIVVDHTVGAFGYSNIAIQPYFPRRVFTNFPHDRSYWDWSTRNRVNEPGPLFSAKAPDYVILGYKARSDMDWLTRPLQLGGYRQVEHFDGHLFWQTSVFEAESFDLYKRYPRAAMILNSYIEVANTSSADQLVSGFYPPEGEAWRWTAGHFSAMLAPIARVDAKGMQLSVNLYISPDQISRLGPVTITGDVDGYRLPPETYVVPGSYSYERRIPANILGRDVALVSFELDKFASPSKSDDRELGVVVKSLGFR